MNIKDRFRRVTHFKEADRGIYCEWCGFWPSTITRWKSEGLPLKIENRGRGAREDIDYFFGFDKYFHGSGYTSLRTSSPLDGACSIGIDFWPMPRFIPRIIEETDRYICAVDERGITTKILKDTESVTAMPAFIDYPVKTQDDWEKMKKRLDPRDPRRYPLDWGEDLIKYYNTATDRVVGVILPGFYIMPWYLMGLNRLLIAFYKEPDFIHEMMDYLTNFYIETMSEAVRKVKLDFVNFWEDFAYSYGPSISPKLFREFMMPHYKKIISFLKNCGVDVIGVDCDGDFTVLIPLLLEAGVNWLWPLEVAGNMDANVLREKYGNKLVLQGNIDKRALAAGKKAIEKEVSAKLPLVKEGGFIPHTDHHVSSDISLENYCYYNKLLKKGLSVGEAD